MRLLIDGYNLLHATDLFGHGALAGTLRGSREALLDSLRTRLPEKLRRDTVIVFDAADAPPGLPARYELEGIKVWFARGYAEADQLIEEILLTAKGTRQLTVVSGDRRVQRAARSCGAKPIDSTAWYTELRRQTAQAPDTKPNGSVGGTKHWVDEFSDPETLRQIEQEAAAAPPPKPLPKSQPESSDSGTDKSKSESESRKKKRRHREGPLSEKGEFGAGIFDPFPPGYAEDLLDDSSDDSDPQIQS